MDDHDIEIIARRIAACKMGLIKTPGGRLLPDWAWHRYREQATQLLAFNELDDALDLVEMLVQPS